MAIVKGLKPRTPIFIEEREIYDVVETNHAFILSPSFALIYTWLYTYESVINPGSPYLLETTSLEDKPFVFYPSDSDGNRKEEAVIYPSTYLLLFLTKHFGSVSSQKVLELYSRHKNNYRNIRTTNPYLKEYLRSLDFWEKQSRNDVSFFYSVDLIYPVSPHLITVFDQFIMRTAHSGNEWGQDGNLTGLQLFKLIDKKLFSFQWNHDDYQEYVIRLALEKDRIKNALGNLSLHVILKDLLKIKQKLINRFPKLNEQTQEIIHRYVPQQTLYELEKANNEEYIYVTYGIGFNLRNLHNISNTQFSACTHAFIDNSLNQLGRLETFDKSLEQSNYILINEQALSLPHPKLPMMNH